LHNWAVEKFASKLEIKPLNSYFEPWLAETTTIHTVRCAQ